MELYLNLKTQWFDMIEQGIKKEEYREMKQYWTSRIWNKRGIIKSVTFSCGLRFMTFEVTDITQGRPKPEWTAEPNRTVYILHLGKRLR